MRARVCCTAKSSGMRVFWSKPPPEAFRTCITGLLLRPDRDDLLLDGDASRLLGLFLPLERFLERDRDGTLRDRESALLRTASRERDLGAERRRGRWPPSSRIVLAPSPPAWQERDLLRRIFSQESCKKQSRRPRHRERAPRPTTPERRSRGPSP